MLLKMGIAASLTITILLGCSGSSPQPARNTRGGRPAEENSDNSLGERYALLVGVAKYPKTSGLRTLQYTENDVEELAQVLENSGYRRENVILMTQKHAAENPRFLPTATIIRQELKNLLRDLSPNDSLLIAFAGHGVQFGRDDESFFCPADANIDSRTNLVSLKELYVELENCPAGFKLLLNDACRNDPFVSGSRRATVDVQSATRPLKLAPPGGLAVLFSCSENEVAWENEKLRHGVFFHFLIAGLKGEADLDGDRDITLEELSHFTKKRVNDLVRAEYDGARQMPNLVGNTRGLVPLVKLKQGSSSPANPAADATGTVVSTERSDDKNQTSRPAPAQPRVYLKEFTNEIGMTLIEIPVGEFLMGSADSDKDARPEEKPQHRVRITKPFLLGKHEVTQGEWSTVMQTKPWMETSSDHLIDRRRAKTGKMFPVTYVDWNAAVEFCQKMSKREGRRYRLPTEAEWEYACRAGTTTRYHFGDDATKAWGEDAFPFAVSSAFHPEEVGRTRANPFGLRDMHGNVSEWSNDWYEDAYYGRRVMDNPSGPENGIERVVRGAVDGYGKSSRSASRQGRSLQYGYPEIGFRVACDLPEPAKRSVTPKPLGGSKGGAKRFRVHP